MPKPAEPVTFVPWKPRKNFTDLSGKVFSNWTVKSFHGRSTKGKYYYLCECACGTIESVRADYLTSGITISCGCVRNPCVHGDCGKGRTPEYRSWCSMKSRCLNKRNKKYKDYGGRGITICQRWISSYSAFLSDVGRRPHHAMTIHRVDNDGNYEPKNVVWATKEVQATHRRSTKFITFNGKTLSVAQWGRELEIKRHTLYNRLNRNLPIAKVLSRPKSHRTNPRLVIVTSAPS